MQDKVISVRFEAVIDGSKYVSELTLSRHVALFDDFVHADEKVEFLGASQFENGEELLCQFRALERKNYLVVAGSEAIQPLFENDEQVSVQTLIHFLLGSSGLLPGQT